MSGPINIDLRSGDSYFATTNDGKSGVIVSEQDGHVNVNALGNVSIDSIQREQDTITVAARDLDTGKEFKLVISLKPDSPQISPPGGGSEMASMSEVGGNRWFDPSFLAAYTSIMNKVLGLLMKMSFVESKLDLLLRQLSFEIGKEQAELKKEEAYNRAAQKLTEAMGCFMQAAVAGVQFAVSATASARSMKAANDKYGPDINTARTKEAAAQKELADWDRNPSNAMPQPPRTAAGDNINDPAVKAQYNADLKAWKDRRDVVEQKYTSARDARIALEHKRDEYAHQDLMIGNTMRTAFFEVLSQTVKGGTLVMNAGLEVELGNIQAQEALNETYLKAYSTLMDNTTKYRDQAAQNFDTLLRQMMDLIKADIQAHTIRVA